jgi:hypothetical protein
VKECPDTGRIRVVVVGSTAIGFLEGSVSRGDEGLQTRAGAHAGTSSAADGGDDGDFQSFVDGGGEAAGVADIFVSEEDVDVLADLALFVDDAVADAGIERPERGERVGDSAASKGNLDSSASGGEFAQGSGDLDGDGQNYLLVVRRDFCRLDDLDVEADFEADERGRDSGRASAGMTEPSSMTAVRTQAIEGRLS